MISRCRNESDVSYKRYGARGIQVCARWNKFENFLEDMGERPEGLTLERKDSNGDYEKRNCRWATRRDQTRNRNETKLTLDAAVSIVKGKLNGEKTSVLAIKFNVAERTVLNVAQGIRWPDARQKVLDARKQEAIRRAGKDPVQYDTRPLSEIMGDEIPYLLWAKQAQVITRTGNRTWAELLKERYAAKVERARYQAGKPPK